jgi:EmrB/QacA subfamily drug resistance transporter
MTPSPRVLIERRWKVLLVVSVAILMASLDQFVVNVAFPTMRRELPGATIAGLSWVLSAYAIVYAALLLPAGRFADLTGRRRAFLCGVLVFAAGSALCGVAPSVPVLVAARVLQAAGAAILTPPALALLLVEFPPSQRALAIGVYAGVGAAAAAAGPPLGGVLVQLSWRLVFLVNLPVAAAAIGAGLRILRESRDSSARRPDLPGTALLAAAVGLLALGLVEAPDWGWASVPTAAALAGGLAGGAVFWARCLRHPSPVVDPSMLRVRTFAMATATATLFSAAFAALLLSNVLFVTDVWRFPVLTVGLVLVPGPLTATAVAFLSGRLAARIGSRTLAVAGLALLAAACAWWRLRLGVTPEYLTGLLLGQLLSGAAVGLTLPSLTTIAASSLPPQRFATGSGVINMSRQIGFVLGVAILVAILGSLRSADPMTGFDGGWTFMTAAACVGVLAALGIGELRRPGPVQAPDPAPQTVRT